MTATIIGAAGAASTVAGAGVLSHLLQGSSGENALRRFLLLTLGWILTIFGTVLCFTPVPIPLIGLLPAMAGLAMLIENSRTMRRLIQRVRHRVRWFSYMLEHFAHRLPKKIAQTLHRSHPAPIARKERIKTRSEGEG